MPKLLHSLWREPWAIATCVRVTLRDGSVFGATTWGEAIEWDGLSYDPSDGAQMETFSASVGTQVTMFKFTGLLGSRFSADDVRFLWPGASVLVFNLIPEQSANDLTWNGNGIAGADMLVAGKLGAIEIPNEVSFTAEFRATMQSASGPIQRSVGSKCPFKFGTFPCPATPPTHVASLGSVSGDHLTLTFTASPTVTFERGSVEAITGANVGVQPIRIRSYSQAGALATVVLADSFPFALSPGDSLRLTEGCRRDWPDCKAYNPAVPGVHTAGWPFGGFKDVPEQDRINVVG